MRRKHFPPDGMLYQTTNGLFFLPYRKVTAKRMVEQSSHSFLWTIASLLWSPLMFVIPFMRSRSVQEVEVEEAEPIRLETDQLQYLADLLVRTPGAFFTAARDVASMKCKRDRWIVGCHDGRDVILEPLIPGTFRKRMEDLLETDAWIGIPSAL